MFSVCSEQEWNVYCIFYTCKKSIWLEWLYGSSNLKHCDLGKLETIHKLPFRVINSLDEEADWNWNRPKQDKVEEKLLKLSRSR